MRILGQPLGRGSITLIVLRGKNYPGLGWRTGTLECSERFRDEPMVEEPVGKVLAVGVLFRQRGKGCRRNVRETSGSSTRTSPSADLRSGQCCPSSLTQSKVPLVGPGFLWYISLRCQFHRTRHLSRDRFSRVSDRICVVHPECAPPGLLRRTSESVPDSARTQRTGRYFSLFERIPL